MSVRARRSLIVLALAATVTVAALAVAWYVLGEERRLGRLTTGVLASRTGLPISVERAAMDGSRLRLRGVRLPATAGRPLDVRIGEVEVIGGVLPLLAPSGRRVSAVARATSVTVPESAGGPPDAAGLDALRDTLRGLLDWPGALTLRVEGGELRAGGLHHFGLTADKTAGALTLARAPEPGARARALRVEARSTGVAGGGVRIEVDLAGEPRQLGGLWPAAVPPPASLAARSELSILRDGQMTATGRLTVVAAATPAVIDFASRYDARGGRLTVPRYALDWGADVHLEGQAEVTAGLRISGTARGTVDGSPFGGRATYETTSGALDGEVTGGRLLCGDDQRDVPAGEDRQRRLGYRGSGADARAVGSGAGGSATRRLRSHAQPAHRRSVRLDGAGRRRGADAGAQDTHARGDGGRRVPPRPLPGTGGGAGERVFGGEQPGARRGPAGQRLPTQPRGTGPRREPGPDVPLPHPGRAEQHARRRSGASSGRLRQGQPRAGAGWGVGAGRLGPVVAQVSPGEGPFDSPPASLISLIERPGCPALRPWSRGERL